MPLHVPGVKVSPSMAGDWQYLDYGQARVTIGGEREITVVFGEDDAPTLQGTYTIAGLALAVDPTEQRLVPTPLILYQAQRHLPGCESFPGQCPFLGFGGHAARETADAEGGRGWRLSQGCDAPSVSSCAARRSMPTTPAALPDPSVHPVPTYMPCCRAAESDLREDDDRTMSSVRRQCEPHARSVDRCAQSSLYTATSLCTGLF